MLLLESRCTRFSSSWRWPDTASATQGRLELLIEAASRRRAALACNRVVGEIASNECPALAPTAWRAVTRCPEQLSESQRIIGDPRRQAKRPRRPSRWHLCAKDSIRHCKGPQGRHCRHSGHRGQVLLDAQELVVFGEAVGARQRAGSDWPQPVANSEIGNGRILASRPSGATSPAR